jgi:hypothetical protein
VRCLFDQEQETPAARAQFVRRRSAVTGVLPLLGTVSLSLARRPAYSESDLGWGWGRGGHDALEKRKKSPGGGRKRTVCRRLSSTVWWRVSGIIWGTVSDIGTRMQAKNLNVKIGDDTSEGCDRSEIWEQP